MKNEHWIIKKSKDGQFYFVFLARNGKVIVTSEMYTQKHNAIKAIALIHETISQRRAITVLDETNSSLEVKEIPFDSDEMISITKERLEELLDTENFMGLLDAAGVDNWDGYGIAQDMRNEE